MQDQVPERLERFGNPRQVDGAMTPERDRWKVVASERHGRFLHVVYEYIPDRWDHLRAPDYHLRGGRMSAMDIYRPRTVSDDTPVWIVRGGQNGEWEDLALARGVITIGWSKAGLLDLLWTRPELRHAINEGCWGGTRQPKSLDAQAAEVWKFLHELAVDDLVLMPLKSRPGHVAVGRITGSYERCADGEFEATDAQNTRACLWLDELPYDAFDEELRYALGARWTVSRVRVYRAAPRVIAALA
jgi:hypothetical protein